MESCGEVGRGGGLGRLAPLEEHLVGLVPSPCGVGRGLKLTTYLPLAFHGMLLDEKSHREHTLIFGGGIGKAYETRGV